MAGNNKVGVLSRIVAASGISENAVTKVLVAFGELSTVDQDFAISAAQKVEGGNKSTPENLQAADDKGAEALTTSEPVLGETAAKTEAPATLKGETISGAADKPKT